MRPVAPRPPVRLVLAATTAAAVTVGLITTPGTASAAAPVASPTRTVAAAAKPAKAATAKPRITKVRAASASVPRGRSLVVSAVVTWKQRAATAETTVSFVLARSHKKRKGDAVLGTDTGLGKSVSAGGVLPVPAKTRTGKYWVLACVGTTCGSSAKTVRVVKPVATSADKLAAAVRAGRLNADTALLYRYYGLFGDKRLPKQYRGAAPTGFADEALGTDVLTRWDGLSPALRTQILPFLLPPTLAESAYGLAGGYRLKTGTKRPGRSVATDAGGPAAPAAQKPAATLPRVCRDHNLMDSAGNTDWLGHTFEGLAYQPVDTSDGKARIWHRVHRTGEKPYFSEKQDAQLAKQIAEYLPGLWKQYAAVMGREPVSDAGHQCFDGGDGRLDIYIFPGSSTETSFIAHRTNHIWFDKPSCTGSTFINLMGVTTKWAVAHELFHAFQNAFPIQGTDCGAYSSLDEGSASWAATMAVPTDKYHQTDWRHQGMLEQGSFGPYNSWPFWMYLAKTSGNTTIRNIYQQVATNDMWHAIDKGIPGGMAKQWPAFAKAAWNTSPPYGTDPFLRWDGWAARPQPGLFLDVRMLTHGSAPVRVTYPHKSWQDVEDRQYAKVWVDAKVKTLQLDNPGHADQADSLQALIQYADGHWKYEDYTGRDQVQFCPASPDERVQQLVLITARFDLSDAEWPDHRPVLTPDIDCSPHYQVSAIRGTFDLTYSSDVKVPTCHVSGTEHYDVSLDPARPRDESGIESDKHAIINLPASVLGQQQYSSTCNETAGQKPDPCTSVISASPQLWWAGFYRPDGAANAEVTLPNLLPTQDPSRCSAAFHDGGPGPLLDEPDMMVLVPWSTITAGKPFTVTVTQGPFAYHSASSNSVVDYTAVSRSWSITFSPLNR